MQLQCIKFSVSVCGKINEHTERLLNVRLIRFGGVLWESSLNFSVGQGKRKKGEQSEENSCAVETVEEGSKRPETHCVCVYVIQRNNKTFLYGFCLDRVLLCVFFFSILFCRSMCKISGKKFEIEIEIRQPFDCPL